MTWLTLFSNSRYSLYRQSQVFSLLLRAWFWIYVRFVVRQQIALVSPASVTNSTRNALPFLTLLWVCKCFVCKQWFIIVVSMISFFKRSIEVNRNNSISIAITCWFGAAIRCPCRSLRSDALLCLDVDLNLLVDLSTTLLFFLLWMATNTLPSACLFTPLLPVFSWQSPRTLQRVFKHSRACWTMKTDYISVRTECQI